MADSVAGKVAILPAFGDMLFASNSAGCGRIDKLVFCSVVFTADIKYFLQASIFFLGKSATKMLTWQSLRPRTDRGGRVAKQ
jgi:hypothetical protein